MRNISGGRARFKKAALGSVLVCGLGFLSLGDEAQAGHGFGFFPLFPFFPMGPRYYGHHNGYGSGSRHGGRHSHAPASTYNGPAEPSADDSQQALAGLAPPTGDDQRAVLKEIYPVAGLGAVGSTNELDQIGKSNGEEQRDYASIVAVLIDKMNKSEKDKTASKDGDVTERSILDSLDNAVRDSNLVRFETFLGEDWSPERLRVMILVRSGPGIDSLFRGTAKTIAMHDLDSVIKTAARGVYAQLFETSELLAANRGATLFMERLYQTQGDLVNDEVRDKAERLLEQVSVSGITTLEPLLRREANDYTLRYRAQRIAYDCLSENVEAISSSESGMATAAEISKRVLDVNQQVCAKWVAGQLFGPENKVKPQQPVPLRVIWSASGPKDDPSMYGRATDQL